MSSLHLPRLLSIPTLLVLAVAATAADRTSGFRFTFSSLPKDGSTDLTIKDNLGNTVGSTSQQGSLDGNWRITGQWVTVGVANPVGLGIAWGPYYGRITASNPLGTVTHQHLGMTLEPMAVWNPIRQLGLEGSVSGSFGYAQGEMLLRQTGSETSTEKSRLGMAYDVTLHLRPVWHPTDKIELFGDLTYTPVFQERFNYKPSGLEVVEVNSYNGAGFGIGGSVHF